MKPFSSIKIIILPVLALFFLTSCSLIGTQNTDSTSMDPGPLTRDTLTTGDFFIKSGDGFSRLPSGSPSFDKEEEGSPDPENVLTFLTGKDDPLIPTLNKDDELVFYSDKPLPESFRLERFYDCGYSFGIFGMKESTAGVSAAIADGCYAKGSDFENTVSESVPVNKNTVLLINAIGGKHVSGNDLSVCGSVMGLKKDSVYKTDLYVGTMHYGLSLKADTHVFSSFELFSVEEYDLNPDGYAALKIPEDLLPGYYYVAGKGMFRYIGKSRNMNDEDIDMNAAYFIETENGETVPYYEQSTGSQQNTNPNK